MEMLSSSRLPLQRKNEYENWNEFKALKIGNQIFGNTARDFEFNAANRQNCTAAVSLQEKSGDSV